MQMSSEPLTRFDASRAGADRHVDAVNAATAAHGIATRLRI